jgi:hypothetical protein
MRGDGFEQWAFEVQAAASALLRGGHCARKAARTCLKDAASYGFFAEEIQGVLQGFDLGWSDREAVESLRGIWAEAMSVRAMPLVFVDVGHMAGEGRRSY